jgi:hypothetical protein
MPDSRRWRTAASIVSGAGPPGGAGLALAAPQHPHALALLGQVHELEVRRERLQHAPRLGERQALDAAYELLPRRLVAGAVRFRERAHVLDQVEERPALLLDERLAEQFAEPVDLFAEPVALCCHRESQFSRACRIGFPVHGAVLRDPERAVRQRTRHVRRLCGA